MTHDVFVFTPDPDRFDSIMIDAPDVVEPLQALQNGADVDAGALKFSYFKGKRKGDFPSLTLGVPVLSERAWNVLAPLVKPLCRVYELSIVNERYYALSARHIVDCLDRDASELRYFRGYILTVESLALIDERINGAPIFRIKGLEEYRVFLSAEFMSVVTKHRLQGLKRVKVWPKAQGLRPKALR